MFSLIVSIKTITATKPHGRRLDHHISSGTAASRKNILASASIFICGEEGAEASSLERDGGEAESLRCSDLGDDERLGETDRPRPLAARL
jgi:hypothetical protein